MLQEDHPEPPALLIVPNGERHLGTRCVLGPVEARHCDELRVHDRDERQPLDVVHICEMLELGV